VLIDLNELRLFNAAMFVEILVKSACAIFDLPPKLNSRAISPAFSLSPDSLNNNCGLNIINTSFFYFRTAKVQKLSSLYISNY
jgi:hypothetical protein